MPEADCNGFWNTKKGAAYAAPVLNLGLRAYLCVDLLFLAALFCGFLCWSFLHLFLLLWSVFLILASQHLEAVANHSR